MESPIESSAVSLWTDIAARLQSTLNETTYSTWFGQVRGLALDDVRLVLAVPNDFTREWIEGHFLGLIGAAVDDETGRSLRVDLQVVPLEPPAQAAKLPSPLPPELEQIVPVAPAATNGRPPMNPK